MLETYILIGGVVAVVLVGVFFFVRRRRATAPRPTFAAAVPPSMRYCVSCGAKIVETDDFCTHCGGKQT